MKIWSRLRLDATPKERDERLFYLIGLVLSVLLTVAAFAVVVLGILPNGWAIPAIVVLALAQIVVQVRFFLHIDFSRQKREDLQLLLFTILLLGIMAFGTLWIMANLASRM